MERIMTSGQTVESPSGMVIPKIDGEMVVRSLQEVVMAMERAMMMDHLGMILLVEIGGAARKTSDVDLEEILLLHHPRLHRRALRPLRGDLRPLMTGRLGGRIEVAERLTIPRM